MKTRFVLSALAVAAIAFAGCNKIDNVIDTPESSVIPFSFTAVNADTKTTNDGVHTNWAASDQVNLFHAEAGDDDYVDDGAFTAASAGSSVKFSGTLASSLTADNYDWYAIYPYSSYVHTPASTSSGYITVGSGASAKQTQTGNSNKTHIAGDGYPVAGKVLNVAKATQPAIPMSQLTSLVEVNVTNGLSSAITVTEVSLTGTEDIVGTYYIDFVSSPVVYTSSGGGYVSNTATLKVTSGTTIAKDASATFYLAVKPFTAPSAGTLTLAVTADNGKQSKEKVLASAFSFAAGEVNTLNFTYNKAAGGPVLKYTLDGTETGGTNKYDTASSITQNKIEWSATGNTTTNPWRIGGKSITNENRVIYSTTAISNNICKIEVESGSATITVNSLTISVHNSSSDASTGANALASITESNSSKIVSKTVTLDKADATSWAGKYYRIVYNVTNSTSSNQYIQFKSAKFYE